MPAVGCVLVEWEAPTRGTQWRLHRGGGVRGWVEAVGMERGQVEQGEGRGLTGNRLVIGAGQVRSIAAAQNKPLLVPLYKRSLNLD